MAITIKDVAKKANVSIGTVSRVLNNRFDINKQIRQKVIEVVKELNYIPNPAARLLRRNAPKLSNHTRTGNIGLVISLRSEEEFFNNPFYSEIFEAIETELTALGYSLVIVTKSEDTTHIPKIVEDEYVDGLLFTGVRKKDSVQNLRNFPLVLIGNYFIDENFNSVVSDNENGAYQVVEYLVRLGHQKIGFVSCSISTMNYRERWEGYKRALTKFGLSYKQQWISIKEGTSSSELMKGILSQTDIPTAIFCANDVMAISSMNAIKEAGLKIPEDISIVGFDNLKMAQESFLPLTTVDPFRNEMGKAAVKQLLEIIESKNTVPRKTTIAVKLIERESCCRL